MGTTIRAYRAGDLGRILKLWERTGHVPVGPDDLTLDQAVDLMTSEAGLTLVAEINGEVAGMAAAVAAGAIGWIARFAVDAPFLQTEVPRDLLAQLESGLAGRGVRTVFIASIQDHQSGELLRQQGFHEVPTMRYLRRDLPVAVPVPETLTVVGGRMIDPNLWNQLRGMEDVKQIIERRVILPLAESALAARHGVASPKAIVLFGPPGTGKTTFAKGIASRLEWPFVEIEPAELAGEGPEPQAKLLAEAFDLILGLSSAVVFVDEVEDLASVRHELRRASPSVTNEFLKQIPRLREASHHLLVCATNWVSRLDPAFLRPGRFDFVLPVEPPDDEARQSIWERYVGEITDEEVALDKLVQATALFTPADIEFTARKAAQQAFEREAFEGTSRRATTEDFMEAIRHTKPSLSEEILGSFRSDTELFARY